MYYDFCALPYSDPFKNTALLLKNRIFQAPPYYNLLGKRFYNIL